MSWSPGPVAYGLCRRRQAKGHCRLPQAVRATGPRSGSTRVQLASTAIPSTQRQSRNQNWEWSLQREVVGEARLIDAEPPEGLVYFQPTRDRGAPELGTWLNLQTWQGAKGEVTGEEARQVQQSSPAETGQSRRRYQGCFLKGLEAVLEVEGRSPPAPARGWWWSAWPSPLPSSTSHIRSAST